MAAALLDNPQWANGHIAYKIGAARDTVKIMRTRLEHQGYIPHIKVKQRRDGKWVGQCGERWVLESQREEAERKLALLEEGS